MRILVLTPFGRTEPGADLNLRRVARPDTEVAVECIDEVFPLPYNTYRYNTLKCTDGAVERIIQAERQGYDAVVVSCTFDPGVFEARGVVDIPVTGILESAILTSLAMGQLYSVVCPEATAAAVIRRLISTYGLGDRCASVLHIGIVARNLYPEIMPTEVVVERLLEVGQRCLDDGAEVLIPGCSIIGTLYTAHAAALARGGVDCPVLDPQIAAFKMAEMMVDLRHLAGYPAVSRAGMWQKQPAEEYRELRSWLREAPSPYQAYSEMGTPPGRTAE